MRPTGSIGSTGSTGSTERLGELFAAGALLRAYLVQDYKLKYRRSVMGFLWSLLNPLLMLAVISAAFSFAFHRDGSTSYTLHLLATLVPWLAFSQSIEEGSRSVVGAERLIRQFYVPKLVFPLRRVLFRMFEFVLFMTALFAVAAFLGLEPGPQLLVLPFSFACLLLFACGLGSLGAVIVVYFRDAEHLVSVGLRAWFYLSPIIVPYSAIPPDYRWIFAWNPMFYVLELFDAPIARGQWPSEDVVLVAAALSLGVFVIGLASFLWTEDELVFRL